MYAFDVGGLTNPSEWLPLVFLQIVGFFSIVKDALIFFVIGIAKLNFLSFSFLSLSQGSLECPSRVPIGTNHLR